MLDGHSDSAQRVVSSAISEARQLGHPHVGTEHLLLGLLADDHSVAADVLRDAGASRTSARHTIAELVAADAEPDTGSVLPFTARAQRALERAGRFSRRDREPEVTAEHVLLGVLDVEGLACQVLRGLSVDIVQLRTALVQPRDEVAAPTTELPTDVPARPRCSNCGASLDVALVVTAVEATNDDGASASVTLAFCSVCGTTVGTVPAGLS